MRIKFLDAYDDEPHTIEAHSFEISMFGSNDTKYVVLAPGTAPIDNGPIYVSEKPASMYNKAFDKYTDALAEKGFIILNDMRFNYYSSVDEAESDILEAELEQLKEEKEASQNVNSSTDSSLTGVMPLFDINETNKYGCLEDDDTK